MEDIEIIYEDLLKCFPKDDVVKEDLDNGTQISVTVPVGENIFVLSFAIYGEKRTEAILVAYIADIKKKNKARAYKLLNELNQEYSFLRFFIKDDLSISAQYDFTSNNEDLVESIEGVFFRAKAVIEDAYPALKELS